MQVRVALPAAGACAAASWGSTPDTGPTSGTARPGSSDRGGGFALEGSGSAASPAVSDSGSLIADDSVRGQIVVASRSGSMTTNGPAQCCVGCGHPRQGALCGSLWQPEVLLLVRSGSEGVFLAP